VIVDTADVVLVGAGARPASSLVKPVPHFVSGFVLLCLLWCERVFSAQVGGELGGCGMHGAQGVLLWNMCIC
jgi:hypothetical protein